MLTALCQSRGGAVAVPEVEDRAGGSSHPRAETGAGLAALVTLVERGAVRHDETVVLFNTGGNKYFD